MSLSFIRPDWPLPDNLGIHALTTTRHGGISVGHYASLNCADHVGDNHQHVAINRLRLIENLNLKHAPIWLNQTHSTKAIAIDDKQYNKPPTADAAFTDKVGPICAVMTADCVPIVLCHVPTATIAAIHAGWRGLCNGIIEHTIKAMNCSAKDILAWIGPCISQSAFELSDKEKKLFIAADKQAISAFKPSRPGHWHTDLVKISTQRLQHCGIKGIYGGQFCTYQEPERFFSYRRNAETGRMVTLVWRSK